MEIRNLEYFAAIVREGTISNAAKALNISQPPLSMMMKQLEEELGVVLFIRGARHIVLTQEGEVFYKRSQEILHLMGVMVEEIDEVSKGIQGDLKLGMISSANCPQIYELLAGFRQANPQYTLEIHEGNTYELINLLNKNAIEAAIVRTPFSKNNFHMVQIADDGMYAVGQASYFKGVTENALTIQSLKNSPLIIYRRWMEVIKNEFQKEGLAPYIACVADDARTTMGLAESGLGIAIVPKSVVTDGKLEGVEKHPLEMSSFSTKLVALFPRGSEKVPKVKSFYDFLEENIEK